MPLEAQVAPVNGINVGDFNADTHLDILLIGNDYGNEVNMGQYDALIGLVLLGDSKGTFTPLSTLASGFMVEGDAKALSSLILSTNKIAYLATQNKSTLEVYTPKKQPEKIIKTDPLDQKAVLTYSDARTEVKEIPYGSGFLSQSTRNISIGKGVNKVVLVKFNGDTRTIDIE